MLAGKLFSRGLLRLPITILRCHQTVSLIGRRDLDLFSCGIQYSLLQIVGAIRQTS